MEKKKCTKCAKTKLINEFYFVYRNSDNRRRRCYCKVCCDKQNSKYYKKYYRKLFRLQPWCKTLHSIYTRCSNKGRKYYEKGIKNFLTREDIKYLWFRDKAYLLKRPSIDRRDSKGNYTLKNCRFIELIENCKEGGFSTAKLMNYRKEHISCPRNP